MEDYLLADCVINNLVKNKILKPNNIWKKTVPDTSFYIAEFWYVKNNSYIPLHISIKENKHCITKTLLINKARHLGCNIETILNCCI